MFTHLHTHSCYSFLEGLASPAQLAEAASRHGMNALALTDRNVLSGAIEFYDACRERGVRPLLGLELDVHAPADLSSFPVRSGRLVLLAIDMDGWKSMCRLSSRILSDPGITEPTLAFEDLAANTAGLLCLTGGRRGFAAELLLAGAERAALRWLGRLAELFTGRLYGELQAHAHNDARWVSQILTLCKRQGIPVLASHTVDYLSPEQAGLQSVVAAARLNVPLAALPPTASALPEAYFLSPSEMAARFAEIPQALSACQEVASRCRLELPLDRPHFPQLDLPPGQTPAGVLRQKAEQGARRLYGSLRPEIQARLDRELRVIESSGYETLFLIVEDILGYARQKGVPLSSRGSAASSLVAHCLGITSPDPLRLNLYFERFLNPARLRPPDIDTDLCSRRRDDVIGYVYQRFGQDRVAMVCTVNRMRSRSALRAAAKAHGLSPAQASSLAERLPNRWYGPPDRFAARQDPYAELEEVYRREPYPAIFRDARGLVGLPDHLSVHPGGIVISPGPLHDLAPTQMAAKGVLVTQFDLESIARLGLVKIDLLGIRGLTVIGDVAEAIQAGGAADRLEAASLSHPDPLAALDAIPENDPATADLTRLGRTIGCFQIESPGMRATLKELQAASVDDLMIALALYRPGPLTGGLKDSFVHRHRGQEPTSHIHPALEPLLADTHGVILYQEQVLRIAHELAGLSLADADLLRRAMSHFDPGQQMKTLQERFVAGALAHSLVPESTAARIWEMMAAFAGYGFPKAHAASYAQIAWRAAWCKLHFPAVFMAAVLANWGGYYSQRVYLMEARRLGLRLRPPDVNHARPEFSVQNIAGEPALIMGLDQVRDLTRRTQSRICTGQPFHSLEDFLNRADPRPGEARSLARAGALEAFGSIPAVLRRLDQGGWQGGQLALFSLDSGSDGDWTVEEKAAAQEEILGVGVIAHPLELLAGQIQTSQALNTLEAAERLGQRVRVAGMRQTWRRTARARGGYIYFMSFEDLEGMLDVVILEEVFRRAQGELEGSGPFIVEGLVEYAAERSEPFMRAERIWKVPVEK